MSGDDPLRERIEELEDRTAAIERSLDDPSGGADETEPGAFGERDGVSRRSVLGAGGLLGASSLLGSTSVGRASAASGSVGSPSNPVGLYGSDVNVDGGLEGALTGDERIESLVGDGLAVESGALSAVSQGDGGLTAVRDAADFSGADGGARIQAAVDDLPDDGGLVFVPAEGPDANGRWDVSSSIVLPSNVEIRGVPGATRLFLVDDANADVFRTDGGSADPTRNAVVRGFACDGNGANNGGSCVGVRVVDAADVRVAHCEFVDFDGHGMEVEVSRHVRVDHCVARDNGDDGVSVSDVHYDEARTENVVVRDCRASGNADNGFECDDGPRHVRFENCFAGGNETNGFTVHTHVSEYAPAAPRDVHFVDCTAANNARHGFTFGHHDSGNPRDFYFRGIVAVGNGESPMRTAVSEASDATVPVENVVIEDFYLEGTSRPNQSGGWTSGIKLDRATPYRDVTIRDGVITGTLSTGIFLRRTTFEGLTIEDVVVEGGDFNHYGIHGGMGGDGNAISDLGVRNCRFENCPRVGIALWPNTGDEIANGQIVDNVCKNNGADTDAPDSLRAGISLNDNGGPIRDLVVSGNVCYDDREPKRQVHGIYRGGDYNVYAENILRENAGAGFGGTAGSNSIENGNLT